jgi:hypothetical protein
VGDLFFHSAQAVGSLGLRGDTAASRRPWEGQRARREEREAEAGTTSRWRRGAQWWRGALGGNRERPEGAARFSRVDGGGWDRTAGIVARRASGRAGEAAGAERRQSHGRVKPREGSFYVPSLFSFSFFWVVGRGKTIMNSVYCKIGDDMATLYLYSWMPTLCASVKHRQQMSCLSNFKPQVMYVVFFFAMDGTLTR